MKLALILISLVAIDCTSSAPKTTVVSSSIAPLPAISNGVAYCVPAQTHLEQLCAADAVKNQYCCQIVQATKKGKPFAQFCSETLASGINIEPECIANVSTCGGVDNCTGTK